MIRFLYDKDLRHETVKGPLLDLRQFSVNESSLKLMKSAFYFTLKVHFVLKIFKCLSLIFSHAEKTV